MKIGVLGSGVVGQTLGMKLAHVGHAVMMGSRDPANPKAAAWAAHAPGASHGSFRDAARYGAIIINATAGVGALAALGSAGGDALGGKVLIDVSNPLDFSRGFPPTLSVVNSDSLAEQIQRAYPDAHVVKALNTVTASVMVDPDSVPGSHVLFIAGDDARAKETTVGLLGELSWPAERIIDLGGVEAARGTEAYMLLWLRLMGATGTSEFNVSICRR